MANKLLMEQYNVNPNELYLSGTYTKNLLSLPSNTLSSALSRIDQMNIPNVSTDLWELIGAQTITSSGVSVNFNIDTQKNYKMLQLVFWVTANTLPSTTGLVFTFNNDSTAAAYRSAFMGYTYAYNTTAPAASTSGLTGTYGRLSDSTASSIINGVIYGNAYMSIAPNAFKHSISYSVSERTTLSYVSNPVYTNYNNTSAIVSSLQVSSLSGTYTGFVKLFGMY